MDNLQNQGSFQSAGSLPPNISKKSNNIKIIWSVAVLALVLILLFAGYPFLSKFFIQGEKAITESATKLVIKDTLPIGYKFEAMAQSKYPTGFPENLIVKGGVWQRAEDTTDGTGNKLKIVELLYKKIEPIALLPSFQKKFKDDGWVIVDTKISNSSSVQIFKKNADAITLLIVPTSKDSLVNITLTTK